MSDTPLGKKKGSENESSEDVPSSDTSKSDLNESTVDEIIKSEKVDQPDPFAIPSLDEIQDIGDVTPLFDAESSIMNVHKIDMEKSEKIPVIDALDEIKKEGEADDGVEPIPSFDDVFGLDKVDKDQTDVLKPSSLPLFEPNLPEDEEFIVDSNPDESSAFPMMSSPFEVYGQKSDDENHLNDESEMKEDDAEQLSPFPPSPPPSPPSSDTDLSPFPPTPETEPLSFVPPEHDIQPSSQPLATSLPLDAVAKKTMNGIVTSFKSVLKTLTRGGSLIDRMEDLREEVEIAEEERLKEELEKRETTERSPFEEVTEIVGPEPQPREMEQSMPVLQHEIEKVEVKEPEPEKVVAEFAVESVAESAAEHVSEVHKDEMRELVGGLSKDEIQSLVGEQIKDAFDNNQETVTPVEPVASITDADLDDLRNDVESSKVLIDEIVNSIKDLSNTVESSTVSMNDLKRCADDFDSEVALGFDSAREKIGGFEDRLDAVENTLTQIQSDNSEMKTGLSNIEQNISDLVGSYSEILSQIQESAQSSDARFEDLSVKIDGFDAVDSKISQIEHNQAIVAGTVSEFGNTTSLLMGDIAEAYEANETLKNEIRSDNTALREEMALVTEYVEKGLKKAGAGSYRSFGQDVELVHLEKNSSTMKLCMEWLEFLMELVGRNNLPDILSYYEELGWISDDIRLELMRYAEGIDHYVEKPDWKLNPDEHVKSIWFIEKLAGVKVDKNKLSIIERDIERLKKGTEIYGI